MKTKELIQKINGIRRMSAKVEKNIIVVYESGMDFSFYSYPINGNSRGDGYSNFINLTSTYMKDLFELLDLIDEYRQTPLAEREEEKRYWLQKIPVPLLDKEGEKKWLWKYTGNVPSNMCVFGADTTKTDSKLYKTIFTESEISQMDITGFEKVEVSE